MSLPSIKAVAQKLGVDLAVATAEQQEQVLVGAMRRDLPLGWEYMRNLARQAEVKGEVAWSENPTSSLGKQLIRLHTDALRPLLERHCMRGATSTFVNCCGGKVRKPGGGRLTLPEVIQLQVHMQDGTLATPDC